MLARSCCAAVVGVDAIPVNVEVDVGRGLPVFQIVGLPETAVRESRDRIRTALRNGGYGFPKGRITVNLSPADIRKEGTGFDLAIALGILAASGLLPMEAVASHLALGELSLDGKVNPVRGALAASVLADPVTIHGILVPVANAAEASASGKIPVFAVQSLGDAADHLAGRRILEARKPVDFSRLCWWAEDADFRDVAGQQHAKRALEIAAAGNHNILMSGPPGSGKTMLARRIPGILPPLSFEEALETSRIYSAAGLLNSRTGLVVKRPFRAPHHTISDAGLVGGGSHPRPGEVSLAHHGVLFLDEFPEFRKSLLDLLRQPLEDRMLTVSRAAYTVRFPASIMLVAAMNPCPCGYADDPEGRCRCQTFAIDRYRARISGPLMDRMDIQIEVPSLSYGDIRRAGEGESSLTIRERVIHARELQELRFSQKKYSCNAAMDAPAIREFCKTGAEGDQLLARAADRLHLSARGISRVLKIARTIADLEESQTIESCHLAEAVQYRRLSPNDGDGFGK
ncbi:YifB family Mg chelatase-like AAA ATPase [Desulfobotulus sp. H1]|uniref:YifB family Mg chelatase-like AAA ATPase n=1 Tax=Desulfobotulus pelophilus TaxID=2823377 RepID=A0ABT3NC01_9BACT|nr:YifB family Mg chelatase-like AAA ATPase [Desulfobotulus pelophilus]MCW7755000.1 YifB family Mg chelatase-like AAA ATPase [Desulfobotulus pelophilus]